MKTTKKRLLLGAHMSISDGLSKAIKNGASIGCTTIQIFTKSNRQWHANPLRDEDIEQFKHTKKQYAIDPIVAHAAYLINIAATDKDILKKSISSLSQELFRCDQLDIPYLILHPGSSADAKQGALQIASVIDEIIKTQSNKAKILLETMAGQGNSLGSSFEQLAEIYSHIHHKKNIGFCIDTCHIFASGYDLRTEATYHKTWETFDNILGLDKIKVIHINDSKNELSSHIDRHENIGSGKIGPNGFSLLFNDTRFIDVPKILETPKSSLSDDLKNMKAIKNLISETLKKKLTIMIP